MRIVFITSKLNFETAGGSVLDLHLKAKSLLELGHEVTVVTAFSRANKINQPLPYTVKEEDIKQWPDMKGGPLLPPNSRYLIIDGDFSDHFGYADFSIPDSQKSYYLDLYYKILSTFEMYQPTGK